MLFIKAAIFISFHISFWQFIAQFLFIKAAMFASIFPSLVWIGRMRPIYQLVTDMKLCIPPAIDQQYIKLDWEDRNFF